MRFERHKAKKYETVFFYGKLRYGRLWNYTNIRSANSDTETNKIKHLNKNNECYEKDIDWIRARSFLFISWQSAGCHQQQQKKRMRDKITTTGVGREAQTKSK